MIDFNKDQIAEIWRFLNESIEAPIMRVEYKILGITDLDNKVESLSFAKRLELQDWSAVMQSHALANFNNNLLVAAFFRVQSEPNILAHHWIAFRCPSEVLETGNVVAFGEVFHLAPLLLESLKTFPKADK